MNELFQSIKLKGKENLSLTFSAAEKERNDIFIFGSKGIVFKKLGGVPAQTIQIIAFSKVGKELLPLIENKVDEKYLLKLASMLKHEKITCQIGDYAINDNQSRIIKLRDFDTNQ